MVFELRKILNESPEAVAAVAGLYAKIAETDFGTNSLFYGDLNYYYPALQDKVTSGLGEEAHGQFTDIIKAGIAEGYFLENINPPVVFEALNNLYAAIARQNAFEKYKILPAEVISHTIDIYVRGICTEKGLKLTNDYERYNN